MGKQEKKSEMDKEASLGSLFDILQEINEKLQILVDHKQTTVEPRSRNIPSEKYEQARQEKSKVVKRAEKIARRNEFLKGIPYSKKQLRQMHRRELAVAAGALGINPFKLKDRSQRGLIKKIMIAQDIYLRNKED